MEALALAPAQEAVEVTRWDEEEIEILAFKLWQRASCPDTATDQDLLEAEAWCHATCL